MKVQRKSRSAASLSSEVPSSVIAAKLCSGFLVPVALTSSQK